MVNLRTGWFHVLSGEFANVASCNPKLALLSMAFDQPRLGASLTTEPQAGLRNEVLVQLTRAHDAARSCVHQSTSEHAVSIGRLLQLDLDIGVWTVELAARPEAQMLTNARRELGFSIYSSASGLYLQAFSNLRLFLELNFAAVYFSVHELLRRRWAGGRHHFGWQAALDPKDGVLSPSFVREFNLLATEDAAKFASTASDCYSACSKFVHGNMVATDKLPQTLQYSNEAMTTWLQTAQRSGESVLYLLYCRYGGDLLPTDDGSLAETLEHWFSHLPSVRTSIGLSTEKISNG